jgi:hypothetical protein
LLEESESPNGDSSITHSADSVVESLSGASSVAYDDMSDLQSIDDGDKKDVEKEIKKKQNLFRCRSSKVVASVKMIATGIYKQS